jgi:hypothetical protein
LNYTPYFWKSNKALISGLGLITKKATDYTDLKRVEVVELMQGQLRSTNNGLVI